MIVNFKEFAKNSRYLGNYGTCNSMSKKRYEDGICPTCNKNYKYLNEEKLFKSEETKSGIHIIFLFNYSCPYCNNIVRFKRGGLS